MKNLSIKICKRSDIDTYTAQRAGETKIGQAISLLSEGQREEIPDGLNHAFRSGARYAIIMIPEDIGPRANCGRDGASDAPEAFLKFFLNMQCNRFLDCSKILLLGTIIVDDLQRKSQGLGGRSLDSLRVLCKQLDERVSPIISEVVSQGFEPIVIGGGNNNSFPIIQGVAEALRAKKHHPDPAVSVVNCDPHADFRLLEGRHSGNPFSYAHEHGYLKRYCVLGFHENYNSDEMLERLAKLSFPVFSYEDFAIRKVYSFEEALNRAHHYFAESKEAIGLELDLDSIKDMPVSAKTPFGISPEQAAQYVYFMASKLNTSYLNLSEAAPKWSVNDGAREVGKCLALQVVTYVKAREAFHTHAQLTREVSRE